MPGSHLGAPEQLVDVPLPQIAEKIAGAPREREKVA